MLTRFVFLAALAATASLTAAERVVVDSAGREVAVPERIERVFAAGGPAAILLYTLAPDRMLGWPRPARPDEREFLAPEYADLPGVGGLTGQGGEANLERVVGLAPDLIVDFGSLRDTYIDLARRVQAQTGIPYLIIDGRFANTPEALRLLGDVLGVPERGKALARDAEAAFERIDRMLAGVPEDQRPRAYLARSPSGLESGVVGSINTEILERAGAVNAVGSSAASRGLVQLGFEALLAADPEVIVTWDRQFYRSHADHPLWRELRAVRQGRVHLAPTVPFGWIDRPPSVNRLIGLDWMASILYPQRYPIDLRERVRAFYRLWYHVDLDEAALDRLMP